MIKQFLTLGLVIGLGATMINGQVTDPKLTEVWEPEPAEVLFDTKSDIPSDANVLLGKDDAKAWAHYDGADVKWTVVDGVMTVSPGTGNILTKENFGDCQLHIEWRAPHEPSKEGQDKGNSGVFFQERYEVQILNSYRNRTYSNGQAAAVYKQHIPLVNATKPSGEWNVYDIIFKAPKYNEQGALVENGTFTVLHNGVLVQNNVEIYGTSEYIGPPKVAPHGDGRIMLQDHSNTMSFRNIWIREL